MFCFLICIFSIAFIFAFIFFSKLKFDFSYFDSGGLEIFLRFLFLKFKIYSPNSEDVVGRKKFKKKSDYSEKKEKSEKKGSKKIFGLDLNFNNIKMLLAPLPSFFVFVGKGIKIKNFEFYYVASSDDAATTAEQYAIVSSLFYWFSGFIGSLIKLQIKKVNILPDFCCRGWQLRFLFRLQVSFGRLVAGFLKYLFDILFSFIRYSFRIRRRERLY